MQESKEDYLFPDKYDVVRFVMGELTWDESEPARIHKSLYLLFGAYSVCRKIDPLLPRYLFPAKFYGWGYGPVEGEVQTSIKSGVLREGTYNVAHFLKENYPYVHKSLQEAMNQINELGLWSLMETTWDEAWVKHKEDATLIDNDEIMEVFFRDKVEEENED